jgi:hypothetical protein
MSLAGVFSLGEDQMASGGQRMIHLIFRFDPLPAVFTAALKHWEKRCWKVLRIVIFGD